MQICKPQTGITTPQHSLFTEFTLDDAETVDNNADTVCPCGWTAGSGSGGKTYLYL